MPVLPGTPPVEITLRRSARARRFSLRVSQHDGRVTLSLPVRAREAEAMAFARAQEDWIRNSLLRTPVAVPVGIGTEVPIEGKLLQLQSCAGRRLLLQDDALLVPGGPDQAGPRVAAYLKVMARERLTVASDHYAGLLGRKVARITLRDTRSRWGSCTSDGALMYSWRLIMAPPRVLSYVAAHEVAHMAEMNHSPAFWAVVDRLFPGWQAERAWLRRHGSALQRLRFSAGD
jgi:predicted metal-dependent hydrolase